MLEIISGIISGIVSALGMGGGTVLIVILSAILGLEQHKAQGTNTIFFIPTSITAIIMNIKNKNIRWDVVKIICPFGMFGAIIGALISLNLETEILKKMYGIFLLIIVIFEIIDIIKTYKKNLKRNNKII